MGELKPIILPGSINYCAAFLTFSCSLRCSYCINHHGGDLVKGRKMSAEDWIKGLNRIVIPQDIPITLQGGEPTVYRGFYEVIDGIRTENHIDILTNLEIDVETFQKRIMASRLRRRSLYASIRVSYHRGQSDREELLDKVEHLTKKGYHIGIWIVDHPAYKEHTEETIKLAQAKGIDIRKKEFLGLWEGVNYGTMRYENMVNSKYLRSCECKTSELLIAPDGKIFKCHSQLYANKYSIGHILDEKFTGEQLGIWRNCPEFGSCNSCDGKLKNDRFQKWGHSSVEIKNISEPIGLNDQVETVINTYGRK